MYYTTTLNQTSRDYRACILSLTRKALNIGVNSERSKKQEKVSENPVKIEKKAKIGQEFKNLHKNHTRQGVCILSFWKKSQKTPFSLNSRAVTREPQSAKIKIQIKNAETINIILHRGLNIKLGKKFHRKWKG